MKNEMSKDLDEILRRIEMRLSHKAVGRGPPPHGARFENSITAIHELYEGQVYTESRICEWTR